MEHSDVDLETRCEYAQVLMAAERASEALTQYEWLLDHHHQLPQQHQLPFLHAVAQTQSVSPAMRAEIERIEAEQQKLGYLHTEKTEFLAYVHANLSEYTAAVKLLEPLVKVQWHRRDLGLLLVDMLYQVGRYAEAQDALESLSNASRTFTATGRPRSPHPDDNHKNHRQ